VSFHPDILFAKLGGNTWTLKLGRTGDDHLKHINLNTQKPGIKKSEKKTSKLIVSRRWELSYLGEKPADFGPGIITATKRREA